MMRNSTPKDALTATTTTGLMLITAMFTINIRYIMTTEFFVLICFALVGRAEGWKRGRLSYGSLPRSQAAGLQKSRDVNILSLDAEFWNEASVRRRNCDYTSVKT